MFKIKSSKKQEIIDITDKIRDFVSKSSIREGLCNVFVRHATAAIIINENYDHLVCEDILSTLNRLVPEHANYKHDKIDNNSHAHIKASILGPSVSIPISSEKLQLGTWQGIGLVEFDGPREREVTVTITKAEKI